MENPIISYKENYKGVIQLNRAESKNTFNKEFAIELNNSLIKFDEDKDVRVVIIEAEGNKVEISRKSAINLGLIK